MNGSSNEWLRTIVTVLTIVGILGGGMYYLSTKIDSSRAELREEIKTNRSELRDDINRVDQNVKTNRSEFREDLGKLDAKVDKLLENTHDNEKRIVRLETLSGIEPETSQN